MKNDFYLHCDKLDSIPAINKENWLFELEFQCKLLPPNATLLQVGCMDGTRIIEILKKRSDLRVTGLEIEKDFLALARKSLHEAGLKADLIEADITTFQTPVRYEYVTCLNNTLGYIPDTEKAIQHMKDAGNVVIISVYGEKFDEVTAKEYFGTLGREVLESDEHHFTVRDFGKVKRFTEKEVKGWGGEITSTPLGYLCVAKGTFSND